MKSGQIRKSATIENTGERDKFKCLKCKYHGWLSAIPKNFTEETLKDNLYCNRSVYEHESCLKDRGSFHTWDSRGKGECELFQPGTPKGDSYKWVGGKL